MILDSERQRTIILELIKSSNFPGAALDEVYRLKEAVVAAGIDSEPDEGEPGARRPALVEQDTEPAHALKR